MKRFIRSVGALAAVAMWNAPADAQTWFTCGRGTVRSVQAIHETVTRDTVTTRRDEEGDVTTVPDRTDQQRRTIFAVTVQLGDRLETSESAGDPYGTLDPMRLAPGDPIDICVSPRQMILERPDGTDYRAPVVRTGLVASRSRS